jgi:hypothetical protein
VVNRPPAGSSGWHQWLDLSSGFPGAAHDEPGCYDHALLQFFKDSIAGRTPNLQSVGISYMHGGKWVPDTSLAMGSSRVVSSRLGSDKRQWGSLPTKVDHVLSHIGNVRSAISTTRCNLLRLAPPAA